MPESWLPDADGDGFGDDGADRLQSCDAPVGYVDDWPDDCDDADPGVGPGADEVCGDGIDQDCDDRDVRCNEISILEADATVFVDVDPYGRDGRVLFFVDVDGEGTPGFALIADDAVHVWHEGVPAGRVEWSAPWWFSDGLRALAGGTDTLVVGASHEELSGFDEVGLVTVLGTPAAGMASVAVILGESEDGRLGEAVASGDFSGDGLDDAVFTDAPSEETGSVYVLDGEREGVLTVGDAFFVAASDGGPVASAGDTDGDGLDDLLVGGTSVRLYRGPLSGGDPDAVFPATGGGDATGDVLARGADVDGDGLVDVVVSSRLASGGGDRRGEVRLYSGALGDVSTGEAFALLTSGEDEAAVGSDIAFGNIDGDEAIDALVGNAYNSGDLGTGAFVLLGPLVGTVDVVDAWRKIYSLDYGAGGHVTLGDLDQDGLDDVFLGDVGYMWGDGMVVVFEAASSL